MDGFEGSWVVLASGLPPVPTNADCCGLAMCDVGRSYHCGNVAPCGLCMERCTHARPFAILVKETVELGGEERGVHGGCRATVVRAEMEML